MKIRTLGPLALLTESGPPRWSVALVVCWGKALHSAGIFMGLTWDPGDRTRAARRLHALHIGPAYIGWFGRPKRDAL